MKTTITMHNASSRLLSLPFGDGDKDKLDVPPGQHASVTFDIATAAGARQLEAFKASMRREPMQKAFAARALRIASVHGHFTAKPQAPEPPKAVEPEALPAEAAPEQESRKKR